MEDAFWVFVDQKWKDLLNAAAAEPAGWGQGADHWKGVEFTKKGEPIKQAGMKAPSAGVNVALADNAQGNPGRAQKRCKFAEVAGCTGFNPLWLCKAFGDKTPEERNRIITDNNLCPFCLLHNADEICFSKAKHPKPICEEPGCKGQHIKWLHKILKEVPCKSEKKEDKVNVIQGEGDGGPPRAHGWRWKKLKRRCSS
jgi:hypothetical protein